MSEIPVSEQWQKRAYIDEVKYENLYRRSIDDPEGFWGEQGRSLDWIKPFTRVKDTSFELHNFHIRWFADGVLNVAVNCIDRHLPKRGNQVIFKILNCPKLSFFF